MFTRHHSAICSLSRYGYGYGYGLLRHQPTSDEPLGVTVHAKGGRH